jgi:transposase-like protein
MDESDDIVDRLETHYPRPGNVHTPGTARMSGVRQADVSAASESVLSTVDETVIQLSDERDWLYTAVDPPTNRLPHVNLSPARDQAITELFPRNSARHISSMTLVDSAPWLQAALHRHDLDYRDEKHGDRTSVDRVFRDRKRRTSQFSNGFSYGETNPFEKNDRLPVALGEKASRRCTKRPGQRRY